MSEINPLGSLPEKTIDEKILDSLTRLAQKSYVRSNQHAAAVIHNDTVLSLGHNQFIKMTKLNYRTIHAEVSALFNIKKLWPILCGSDILVIRYSKGGLKYSRPCSECIEHMEKVGIRKVYYSDHDGKIVYEHLEKMPKIHYSRGSRMRKEEESIQCC